MYIFFKRTFDIMLSLIGVIFLIPLYIIIRLAYFCTGDFHRIIYSQTRIGKHGKPFKMYKFRTMVINADEELKKLLKNPEYKKEWEEYHKIENDPRITKVGRFLRKSSIDEMPQFINVFLGQLSVVGPRPLTPGEIEQHHGDKKLYESVKPGLTGWWAVNGRSNQSYKERLKLEYYYINHCSLGFDFKVLFMTISTVLKKSGAK